MNLRDNLLVTMGNRAAYMDCQGTINLPAGNEGEDELARFVTEKVDNYINEDIDESFDLYIERELENKYGEKKVLNKYNFVVILCEGHQCGTITIAAENEDIAQDMALDYVCSQLASALPELDIDVSVVLEDDYWNV